MPISNSDIVSFVGDLAQEDGLKVTMSESFKGGLVAGTCTVIGGIVAGPTGLAFGAIVGGCMAAYRAQGKFQSVARVLAEMPLNRQEELAGRLRSIVRNIDASDIVSLALLVSGNMSLRQEIMAVVINYIRNELQLQLCE